MSNPNATIVSLLEPPRLPDASVIREELRSIPGRLTKTGGQSKRGIRVRIVLDRRDVAGTVIGHMDLSGELGDRAVTKTELYRARCLYPAARLEVIQD
jgi:hypothetical protein